jgi:hypothetical protein
VIGVNHGRGLAARHATLKHRSNAQTPITCSNDLL